MKIELTREAIEFARLWLSLPAEDQPHWRAAIEATARQCNKSIEQQCREERQRYKRFLKAALTAPR
jgi:hypothetical protein